MLVLVNRKNNASSHAFLTSICLQEALEAEGEHREELLDAAKIHLDFVREWLDLDSPEEAWLAFHELSSLLETFEQEESEYVPRPRGCSNKVPMV
jgi:hypothetical protein